MNLKSTGIVFDIKRFAIHDGPGIRTTVFLKGCPLDCWWCHNPESRNLQPEPRKQLRAYYQGDLLHQDDPLIGKKVTVAQLLQEIEKDRLFFDESNGGVTISGGEPLLQIDFTENLAQALKQRDIHTAIDTTGFAEFSNLQRLLPHVDLWLYDLKLLDDALHRKYTGVSNKPIIQNFLQLYEERAPLLVRVPLIPGFTDTNENLEAIARFLHSIDASIPVELLPYNKLAESKYERLQRLNRIGSLATQDNGELAQKRVIFEKYNIKVK